MRPLFAGGRLAFETPELELADLVQFPGHGVPSCNTITVTPRSW
jgi:hypothetical protein